MFNWIKKLCARIAKAWNEFFNGKPQSKTEMNEALQSKGSSEEQQSKPWSKSASKTFTPSRPTYGTNNEIFRVIVGPKREAPRKGNGNFFRMY